MTRELDEISADMELYVDRKKTGKIDIKTFMNHQARLIQEAIDHPKTSNADKKTMKKQLTIVKLGQKMGKILK